VIFTFGELVRSVSKPRIFIDLYLPRLTHLHDTLLLSLQACSLGAILKSPEITRKEFSLVMILPLMRSHCYLVATLKSQPVVMVASCKAKARPRSQDQEHSLLKVLASTFGLGEREL